MNFVIVSVVTVKYFRSQHIANDEVLCRTPVSALNDLDLFSEVYWSLTRTLFSLTFCWFDSVK